MTVSTVLDTLSLPLGNIPNPLYPGWGGQYLLVKKRPTNLINDTDFPILVMGYDWMKDCQFDLHESGGGHHQYWLALHLFVGGANVDLEELHARIEPWPLLLVDTITSFIRGNDVGLAIPVNAPFLPYRIGKFPWGGGTDTYFGLRTALWINEDF